jgi:D-sedoheptulose 7-phosphate isomerase
VEAGGQPGDVAVGITTSGASANVRAGLETARARGLRTIVMTGTGGTVGPIADILVTAGADLTARVQEAQRTQMHIICELVESQLAADGTGEGHA